ncbi:hypothetical protein [Nocardioides sp.]|uniref:hypothetical protein n=1 Tax=Nocardioides sp. TaxID=35761 RepID=UPI0037852292
MSREVVTEVAVYVLTGLAAVVVVLTRLRLGRGEGGAGRLQTGRRLVDVHTVAGVLALVLWVVFLVGGNDTVGIIALACWWVVVVAGLLILVRWLPTRGKHASEGKRDSWSEGPALSILAHVGMLVGVVVFSWAYLTAAV